MAARLWFPILDSLRPPRYHKSMRAPGKIAVFGGSFDPPHRGHLAIARAAVQLLHLDQILFLPTGVQPLKPGGPRAAFEDRVRMVELAVAHEPHFAVSRRDAPRADGAPNYIWETLAQLQRELPDARLHFLMGADSLLTFRRWFRAAELPFLATLILADRDTLLARNPLAEIQENIPEGILVQALAESPADAEGRSVRRFQLQNAAGSEAELLVLAGLQFDVSATRIRQDGAVENPADLPLPVVEYIRQRNIYL